MTAEITHVYNETGDTKEILISIDTDLLRLTPRSDYAPTAEFQRADRILQALLRDKLAEDKRATARD